MYSIPMAIVDFIPVFFFGAAAFILMRDLYYQMSKGAYAMFCAGVIDVFCAGFLKALYKLLYATELCDFEVLSKLFFPLQSIGFLLGGVALVCFITMKQKEKKLFSVAPIVFTGTPIFISLMVLGLAGMDVALCVIASRMKKKGTIVLFILSCIFSLMMGYLASKDFTQDIFNWIAECVNIIGQASLFIGVKLLDKAGLSKQNFTDKGDLS